MNRTMNWKPHQTSQRPTDRRSSERTIEQKTEHETEQITHQTTDRPTVTQRRPIITAVEVPDIMGGVIVTTRRTFSKTFHEGMRKFDCRERRERFVDGKGHFVDQSIKKGRGGGWSRWGFPQNDYMRGERFTPTDQASNSLMDARSTNFNMISFLSQIFEHWNFKRQQIWKRSGNGGGGGGWWREINACWGLGLKMMREIGTEQIYLSIERW